MCGCECCIFAKSMHFVLLSWHNIYIKHFKDRSQNSQNRRSGELSSHIFEICKNVLRPYGCHTYNYAADMAMEKMYPCPSQHHGLSHWKCV